MSESPRTVAETDGSVRAPSSGGIPPTSVAFKAPSAAEASWDAMSSLQA